MKFFARRRSSAIASISTNDMAAPITRPRLLPHKSVSCGSLHSLRTAATECSSPSCENDTDVAIAPRVGVRFCEERNQVHDSPWVLRMDRRDPTAAAIMEESDTKESDSNVILSQNAVWYHTHDVARFRHDAQSCARLVMAREQQQQQQQQSHNAPLLWSEAVRKAHDGFSAALTSADMNDTMARRPQHHANAAVCVGLEKWVLPSAAPSRKAVVQAVLRQQQQHGPSTRRLRRVSRQHSRVSRLMAIYLGRCVADGSTPHAVQEIS